MFYSFVPNYGTIVPKLGTIEQFVNPFYPVGV
jgi:hypothetical protein